MLTSDQVTQLRASAGLPPTPAQTGAPDILAQRRAALGMSAPAAPTPTPQPFPANNPLENIRTGKSQDNLDVGKGAAKELVTEITSAGAQNAGPVGADMMKNAPDFAKNIEGLKAGTELTNPKQEEGAANTTTAEMVAPVLEPAARLASKGMSALKDAVATTPEDALAAQKREASNEVDKFFQEDSQKVQDATDALHTDKTGKKLVAAYAKTARGNASIIPKSIYQEQGLTPDQQTINLATRLKDIGLGKDQAQNLKTLGGALDDTEAKLVTALKDENSDIVYNADKPTILMKLQNAKIPREFSTIKDSRNLYRNVMNFAQEQIVKTDDTIEGLRNARSAFDAQAKMEYPNAFKEGGVDTSTPAGRAIRDARDMINEHMYNTAPNGSDIQNLIGREADIFRAIDRVAPEAAKGHGQNAIVQWAKNNPRLSRYLGVGASVLGGGFIAHELGL